MFNSQNSTPPVPANKRVVEANRDGADIVCDDDGRPKAQRRLMATNLAACDSQASPGRNDNGRQVEHDQGDAAVEEPGGPLDFDPERVR